MYTRAELDYDVVVGEGVIVTELSYDPHCNGGEIPKACNRWHGNHPHCTNGHISGGCKPVAVLSAEKLRDYTHGPAETAKIANALLRDTAGMGQYVIAPEAWDCIWTKLIVNKKGLKTVYDRPGYSSEETYNFSEEMLQAMITELNRLINKYGSPAWNTKATANRIVELLVEHQALVQVELNEVISGVRKLTDEDILGPKERDARQKLNVKYVDPGSADKKRDYSRYFLALEQKLKDKRVSS